MVWLIKEYLNRFPTLARETFRRLVKGFIEESDPEVKLQILNLGLKVYNMDSGAEENNEQ